MENNNTLPKPKGIGESKSATQRAKERPRPALGGAPPVKMPDFAQAEAMAREKYRQGDPNNRPAQPAGHGARSPEEIKADLEKLNQGMKEYAEKQQQEAQELPKPAEDIKPVGSDKGVSVDDVKELVEQMDDFELDSYAKMLDDDELNSKKRQEAIEGRCKSMDLVDLITTGEVHQRVPIVPGKFEVTYRSVTSGEDLEVKRLLYNIRKEVPRYQVDAYSIMSLTLAIHAINGHPLPTHNDESGNFSEPKFRSKFELVKKYPLQMVADLGVNYIWFDKRVRDLFTVEALGNG